MRELVDIYARAVTVGLEAAGVSVIVAVAIVATVGAIARVFRGDREGLYDAYRHQLARGILLGLELLVAADIINTVALDLTLSSVAVLGAVVLIRTLLSFTLEVELTGHWPWQGGGDGGAPAR